MFHHKNVQCSDVYMLKRELAWTGAEWLGRQNASFRENSDRSYVASPGFHQATLLARKGVNTQNKCRYLSRLGICAAFGHLMPTACLDSSQDPRKLLSIRIKEL